MKKITKFRKGDIVASHSKDTYVLVTGSGNKDEGYPCFAGVTIMCVRNEDNGNWNFPVAMYSDTWGTDAFKKTDLRIGKIIQSTVTH